MSRFVACKDLIPARWMGTRLMKHESQCTVLLLRARVHEARDAHHK
jgi:hypothetical protein